MSKKCPWCKVDVYLTELKHWYRCPECQTEFPERAFPKEINIFDCITSSPEVLAPRLVFRAEYKTFNPMYWEGEGGIVVAEVWKSTIIPDATFSSEPEAIAATVEKLKEIANK